MKRSLPAIAAACLIALATAAYGLTAGVAKIEITDRAAGPVNDPSFVKTLVLREGSTTIALITVDAVAIAEIGRLRDDFLAKVRARLQAECGIPPECIIVNASHCHSIPRLDTDALTVQAVKDAMAGMVPVNVGAGAGFEDGISENRRLLMKDGSEVDMRRAYSLPPDEAVAAVGPIDPQIGLLRIDREDGRPLALVYQFACHPIMNPPSKGNSADFPGFASQAIEENLGHGAIALFVQGCAGDINPVRYKATQGLRDAKPLGYQLGLSALRASRKIEPKASNHLKLVRQVIPLPRAADFEHRISKLEKERTRLLNSLRPTDINFKSFLPLWIQQKLSPKFPSQHVQSYLHDESLGRTDLPREDSDRQKLVDAYLQNIETMEQLTRLTTNLALLKKHFEHTRSAKEKPLEVELNALRIGDFKLMTFPGELTVRIGLQIKKAAKEPHTFVAGYTNGYIYYLPTVEQRRNTGYAQEDCDCRVAPEWQELFQSKALEMLSQL